MERAEKRPVFGAAEALLRPAVFAPLLVLAGLVISGGFVNYRLPASDEGALLTQAGKILRGGVFYRDIDAYPLPGASYVLALALRVFGEHVSVARWLGSLVYCGILVGVYAIALQLLGRRRAAVLGVSLLSFKFVAWPALTAYFYWDVAFCFASAAIALLIGHRYRGASFRLIAAGLCVGIAFTCKQTVGMYLGVATLLLLLFPGLLLGTSRARSSQRWSELAAFAGGAALPLIPMLGYFAAQGVLRQMVYSSLVRPLVAYLPTSGISFLPPLRWWEFGAFQGRVALPYFVEPYWQIVRDHRLPGEALYPLYWLAGELFARVLYTSIPLAFVAVFALWVQAFRRGRLGSDRKLFAFAALALAVLPSAFPRADFPHVISVYPLVLVLLFALWGRLATRRGARAAAAVHRAEAVAAISLVAGAGILTAVLHSGLTYRMTLERADLRVAPVYAWVESIVRFIDDEVGRDEQIFVYGHEAYYYFLSGRYHPWPFVQLYPGQAGGDGGRALAALLDREPPKVVIRGMLKFPGMPYLPKYAPVLAAYLRARFVPDDRVFRRYPLPVGRVPPKGVVRVLRPRADVAATGDPDP